jgi:hypothetical protein
MGHGIDPGLIYKRDCDLVEESELAWSPGSGVDTIFDQYLWTSSYWFHSTDLALLLFCGKAYPYWFTKAEDANTLKERTIVVTCEALIERAQSLYGRRREFKEESGVKRTGDPFFPRLPEVEEFLFGKDSHWGPRYNAKNVAAFAKRVAGTPVDNGSHLYWKALSLLVARRPDHSGPKRYAVLRNPVLKELEFVRVMDSFAAFQQASWLWRTRRRYAWDPTRSSQDKKASTSGASGPSRLGRRS